MATTPSHKDVFQFPIVGSVYQERGVENCLRLTEGAVLTLEHDNENIVDSHAIFVCSGGNKLGYVPNKGVSCDMCWSQISPSNQYCPDCGAGWDHFIKGGLASRMIKRGILGKQYLCYVVKVDPEDKFSIITVEMIVE